MALSFSLAAPVGLAPVALSVLLGPDPLISVPADSLLAIMIPTGLFMPAPNALAGVALPLSIIEGAFGGALHLPAGPGMVAGRSTAATAVALPKWDELVVQLIADGLPAVAYETLGMLAAAVSRVVDALDEDNLPPAYELLGVDIYPLEPVPTSPLVPMAAAASASSPPPPLSPGIFCSLMGSSTRAAATPTLSSSLAVSSAPAWDRSPSSTPAAFAAPTLGLGRCTAGRRAPP